MWSRRCPRTVPIVPGGALKRRLRRSSVRVARNSIPAWWMLAWHFSGSRNMSYPTDLPPWRLEWNEGLSMHIPAIDAEHRRFIELVNDLNEAIIGRMDREVLKRCMRAILDDAAAHFAHEQALFKEWRYPEAGEHAVKHAQIMRALNDIMARFERGG